MPKLKTRKAAAKRYKKTGNNNFLRRHAYKGHLLMKKSKKQKLTQHRPPFVFLPNDVRNFV